MDLRQFESQLREALAAEISAQREHLAGEVLLGCDLGCFPWFGYLELSFLTTDESEVVQADPSSVADWRYYCCNATPTSLWPRGEALVEWLGGHVHDEEPPYGTAEQLWKACARALMAADVQSELLRCKTAPGFLCTVLNPDDPGLSLIHI